MNIDPSVSIVISFLGFALIFAKKVYPMIIKKLDDHIDSVKQKIAEAEKLKDEARTALKNAYIRKDDIEKIVEENRKKSEERIENLRRENDALLQTLKQRYEDSLKTQLEAAFLKQKNILIDKLSDLLIEKLTEKMKNSKIESDTVITKEELQKLL